MLLALPLVRHDPGIDRHVGDRVVAGDEGAIGQPLVEHAVEPVDLVAVAVHRVGNLLHRVIAEMIVLAGHRAEIAHLPEQPLDRVGARAQIARRGTARSSRRDRAGWRRTRTPRSACRRRSARDRPCAGNAVVRGHRQELGLELLALADVHRHDVVGKPGLLEKDRDLVAVRRGPIVEVDHGRLVPCAAINRMRCR